MKKYPLYSRKHFDNFKEMLKGSAEIYKKTAIKYRYEKAIKEISYKELYDRVLQLANALCALNIDDAHIAIVGENSYKWINVFLSLLITRATVVPIDKELPEEQMLNVLNTSDSEIVFYSEDFDDFIKKNESNLHAVKKFIKYSSWGDDDGGDINNINSRFVDFQTLWAYGAISSSDILDNLKYENDKTKLIVYTSGTTGNAKGVMLTQKNIVSCIDGGLAMADIHGTSLSVLPYHHTYASVCDMLGGLNAGVTICINEGLRAVLLNLNEYKPNYMFVVPRYIEVFYERIWKEAERTGKDKLLKKMLEISKKLRKSGIDMRKIFFKSVRNAFGGSLEFLMCGGALLRADLGDFFDEIGIPVIIGYGITECSPLVSANRNEYYDVRTVGEPIPCVELKIEDKDADGIGEILVKGPTVMKGYYKNPEATNEAISDDWFKTGDFGIINSDGRIEIKGRKKDIIVLSNGKNIYPEEIEGYIATIPAVSEVIVYSLENEMGDESALCAEVYLDGEITQKEQLLSDKEKIKYMTKNVKKALSKLPSYKQIRKIVIRETEFEKTTTKKIIRSKIKKAKI